MRRLIESFLLVALIAVGTASAQNVRKSMTVQDLEGEWELTSQETYVGETRVPDDEEQGKEVVRITVKDHEVTFFRQFEGDKRSIERTFIYFSDGRGETNRWTIEYGAAMEKVTKTRWKDGKLLTKGNFRSNHGSDTVESRCRLTNDLQKLECEEVRLRPGPQPPPFARGVTTKAVYRRL